MAGKSPGEADTSYFCSQPHSTIIAVAVAQHLAVTVCRVFFATHNGRRVLTGDV